MIALSFSYLPLSILPTPISYRSAEMVEAQPLPPSEARTRYTLIVDLNYENASLTAKETVLYTNNTSVDLDRVVFNVTPAQFKAFTLNDAMIDGKKVSPTVDGVTMEVPLPEVLPKGKTTTVELDFRVNVPKRGGRFGVGDSIIALGNWFPIVAVYVDSRTSTNELPSGWCRHKYVEVGDAFYTETADYDVTVVTSSPVTIAHTGAMVGKDANRWQIKAKGVRDFAMAISNRYQTQSRSVDGVVITAYFLAEHAALGDQYLEAATQAVLKLNRLVMPYPYPTLHIAEVYTQSSIAQGQEYPNLAFISSSVNDLGGGLDSYLAYIIIHEVTHQWFYSMVGNDQIYQPWLDEAFATWFYYHILRSVAPEALPSVWQKRLLDPLAESIRKNGDSPVNKGIYDFADELHYYNIVYRKGALFIEDLYKTMGETAFFDAVRDYARTFRDRVATSNAFFDLFQSHTLENLNPIIAKYFSYDRYKAGERQAISVEFPPGLSWSGVVRPKIASASPISEVTALVEGSIVWSGSNPADLSLDTTALKNGEEYLLTVRVTRAGQAVELVRRFSVQNEVKKEPTPGLSSPSPGLPSETPTPSVREGSTDGPVSFVRGIGFGGWASIAAALVLLLGLVHAIRRGR